jgi:hypothetical protein
VEHNILKLVISLYLKILAGDGYINKILNIITNKKLCGYFQQEYSKRKCKIQKFFSTQMVFEDRIAYWVQGLGYRLDDQESAF